MGYRNRLGDFKPWNDILKVIVVDAKKLEAAKTCIEFSESGD
jgi:hypothetical protein